MKLSEEQEKVLDAVVEANPGDIITLNGKTGVVIKGTAAIY